MKYLILSLLLLFIVLISACDKTSIDTPVTPTTTTYKGTGSVRQLVVFLAVQVGELQAVGTITSSDGKTWTVPAENNFTNGTKLSDLFNECTGKIP